MSFGNPWLYFLIIAVHFSSTVRSFGADFLCSRIPGLTPKQREICEGAPDALAAIGEGTKLGVSECQHQFRFSRWNCTPVGTEQIFGHVVVVGSREAAFLYAISSAGVTYAITQACARGNISSCGCAPPTTISTSAVGGGPAGAGLKNGNEWGVASGWRWGGCSADVDYAVKLARKFMDSREIEGDGRSLMNLHNNKAGRKAIQMTLETECKCHGVSGSCTLKTCWLKLATFRKIGDKLLEKYKRARPVIAVQTVKGPRSRRSLTLLVRTKSHSSHLPRHQHMSSSSSSSTSSFTAAVANSHTHSSRGHPYTREAKKQRSLSSTDGINKKKTRPRRSDLVFLEQSPNYCELDSTVGSLGTRGRRCVRSLPPNSFVYNTISSSSSNNLSLSNEHSCDILCCGRGYNTHQMWRKWKCHCKFKWCCEVQCQNCQERVEIYTCN